MTTYWVDSAGSNTSPYDTYAKAANSFDTVGSLASAGDIINMVSTHTETFTINKTLNFANGTKLNPIIIVSVNSSGAYAESSTNNYELITTVGSDLTLSGHVVSFGVNFSSTDRCYMTTGGWRMIAGGIEISSLSTGGYLSLAPSSQNLGIHEFDSTELVLENAANHIYLVGNYVNLTLRAIQFTTIATLTKMFALYSSVREQNILIEDTEFPAVTTLFSGDLVEGSIELNRCKLPSGVEILSGSVTNRAANLDVISCDIGDGYHYFEHQRTSGIISEDTATYRTAGATYDDTNGFSAAMIANSNASYYNPLKFELSNFWVNTADYGATIDFKFHFCLENSTTTPTVLNTADCYVELEYADGADNALGVLVDNKAAPLATGTNHATTTGEWTAIGNTLQMNSTITVTKGVNAGNIASGIVRAYMYLCVDADARTTGDLFFADRKVDVS